MCAKILVVDDSSASLMWHKLVLRQGAYDVVTACDGEEGVAKATQEQPDLILMDAVMPKMSGLEASEAIHAVPGLRGVPVVMVMTHGELKALEPELVSGGIDYVVRPVDRDELLLKIASCLNARRAAAA